MTTFNWFYVITEIICLVLKIGFFHCYFSVLFIVVLDFQWVEYACCVRYSVKCLFCSLSAMHPDDKFTPNHPISSPLVLWSRDL